MEAGPLDPGCELRRTPLKRSSEKALPRTPRVLTARDEPEATLPETLGFGPNLFWPGVPSNTANTSSTIVPITGTRLISTHQPVRSMSWSLLTETAMLGMMIASP